MCQLIYLAVVIFEFQKNLAPQQTEFERRLAFLGQKSYSIEEEARNSLFLRVHIQIHPFIIRQTNGCINNRPTI